VNVITQLADGPEARCDAAPFFIKGKLVEGDAVRHRSRDLGVNFATPALALNALVTPRTEEGPLFDVPLSEILDFLVEAGERISARGNPHMEACVERMALTNVLPVRVIRNQVALGGKMLSRSLLTDLVEQNFPNPKVLDEWVPREDRNGRKGFVRAFPPRLVHVLPGNAAVAAIQSIAWASLVKAINLYKMGSSDPFTAVAILRTMAEIDPEHPVVKSQSAVYWRGGDEKVERVLYRPQYFDKVVAWGGGDAINNVIRYLGPGFQLISFDPKTSISLVGRESFASDETIAEVAECAAHDVSILNQEACVASRIIFAEGDIADVDGFCAKLIERIGVDRESASAEAPPLDRALLEEIEALQLMEDDFRVWGLGEGKGLVIRSEEPVDFHPINKTANVVRVKSLDDAMRYVNVATQTVGVYPYSRAFGLRDKLASGGAQRVTRLGDCGGSCAGNPHDATYPLHRFVHWIAHEDGSSGDPD
jgi:Acyl-CoA reductase (LuxC)